MCIVKDIVKQGACSGCGICVSITGKNSKMKMSSDGFLLPNISEGELKPEEEALITEVCPGIHPTVTGYSQLNSPEYSIGCAVSEEVRYTGASGGIISALLIHLLESGQVGYVLHGGVSEKDPFQMQVYMSKTREQVLNHAGSRYAPGAMLQEITKLKKDDQKFAFVGKPCEVLALRRYMLTPQGNWLASRAKLLISFFCAGTPSVSASKKMIFQMGADPNKLTSLRYRGKGWPGQVEAVTDDGTRYTMSYNESWGNILGRDILFRCKFCYDGIGEAADIVLGDAWFTSEDGYPVFEDMPGQSLVVVRTKRGRESLMSSIKSGYVLQLKTGLNYEDMMRLQPNHKAKREIAWPRMLALRTAGINYPRSNWSMLKQFSSPLNAYHFFRQYIGTIRRVIQYKQKSKGINV